MTETKPDNRREIYAKLMKSHKEGTKEETERLVDELTAANFEHNPNFPDDAADHIWNQLESTAKRRFRSRKLPNLPLCVLATMEELKDTGVWDGKPNSTYIAATTALESYEAAEKKRVEYLSIKAGYDKAMGDYLIKRHKLVFNISIKFLEPFSGSSKDPLKWYLTMQELIDMCKLANRVITIPAIRKYQSLGLIPKPIRIGRTARYSLMTVLRISIIDELKKQGVALKDMEKSIRKSLKATVQVYYEKFPADWSSFEQAIDSMTNLTGEAPEQLVTAWQEDMAANKQIDIADRTANG